MNPSMKYTLIFISFAFCSFSASAQDIKVHEMIGKSQSAVIKLFGNPVHQDNSNPSMQCMFYQNDAGRRIFVSNENAVFQAESYSSYGSENAARKVLDGFISSSVTSGYEVDTVSASDFRLKKTGVKVDLQLSENKLSKKYELSVKASKTVN